MLRSVSYSVNVKQVKDFAAFFKDISPQTLKTLEENAIELTYKKGQNIFNEGAVSNGVFYIVHGKVKFCRSDERTQRDIIIGFSKDNSLIGLTPIFNDDIHIVSATCIDDCQVLLIPKNIIKQIISADPSFLRVATDQIGNRNSRLVQKMSHIAFANIREGIALSIIQLLEHFGVDQKGFIDVVLTKAELGQMAATTTSAAIKLSNEFQKDGIIIIEEKKIKIVDMKRLYKSAGIHYKASSFEEGKLY